MELEAAFDQPEFSELWTPTVDEAIDGVRTRSFRWTNGPDLFVRTTYRTAPGPPNAEIQVMLTMAVAGTQR